MGHKALTVLVVDRVYTFLDSPDALVDDDGRRGMYCIDHADAAVWLDPGLNESNRFMAIAHAVSRAWQERLLAVPVVE